jgi:hypothetical protein
VLCAFTQEHLEAGVAPQFVRGANLQTACESTPMEDDMKR